MASAGDVDVFSEDKQLIRHEAHFPNQNVIN